MLGNSCSTGATNEKKIALISSTTNQWPPQNHNHIDDQNTYMDSNPSTVRVMEKPGPELVQLQRQQLKCPRCDSSNTKFCYYNNYSLSQPRHFCKACKRYWTRGGTLRNVPVGGGCRKNKRLKRPLSGSDCVSSSSTTSNSSNLPNLQKTQFDLTSDSNHMISPLFFGFPTNPSDLTLPFSGFDLQPQLNGLFSSGLFSNDGDYNQNGFINGTKQIQQDNIVGSNSSLFSSATMASVLASKFTNGSRGANINNILQSYEEDVRNTTSNESEMNMRMKDVKLEDAKTRLEWNFNFANNCQSQNEQVGIISNPSLYWNATSVGSNWLDPAPNSIGSSVQLL